MGPLQRSGLVPPFRLPDDASLQALAPGSTSMLQHHNKLKFWEKPGCQGNRRQQALLRAQGIEAQILDLLSQPWTARELRGYFGSAPVADWFNQSAPAVKSGAIDIASVDEDLALLLMVNDPILIRRPLLQVDDLKQSGFESGPVLDALGVSLDPESDLQSCPMPADAGACTDPG